MLTSNKIRACVGVAFLSANAVSAQVSSMVPPQGRAMLDSIERFSPNLARNRQRLLDSLASGRRQWNSAKVADYRLQTHVECFCFSYPADSSTTHPLVVVRSGAIVAREPGKAARYDGQPWTVDSLFAVVARDIRDVGRVVKRLTLHPVLGFPIAYDAETPRIPDFSVAIRVDSFAVIPPRR